MNDTSEAFIRKEAARIVASGALGRSRSYLRLFEYLVENSLSGRSPKEIEIAAEVFSRDKTFDPAQDSMVRVYAHNLRQKISQFYDKEGAPDARRLTLSRGEYRIVVAEDVADDVSGEVISQIRPSIAALAAAAAALAGIAVGYLFAGGSDSSALEPTVLWQALADDDLPVQVVVGDYYIFAEMDQRGNITRFVREFAVNSADDLSRFEARANADSRRYQDLGLTYLAQSSGPALGDVLGMLNGIGKQVEVVSMSQFDPAVVRTHHVVYVGYFSALDKLFDFTFAASQLAIGATYDELLNIESGDVFESSAGFPDDYRNYRDYAYFSTFPGPAGNQLVIVAGTRDEGVLHISQVASDTAFLSNTAADVPTSSDGAFELLYEVTGFDRTHIDSMLVHAAPLDVSLIWSGTSIREFSPGD